jgi:cell envelope opacity-associated protein A
MRQALLVVLGLAIGLAAGCSYRRQSKLDVYKNLMTPYQRAKYELMEQQDKPMSLRLAYLQEIKVYQKWAELPKDVQEAVLRRKVVEGMTADQVQMAWGLPDQKRDITLPAERAEGHTKMVWDYHERHRKPGHYERTVCFLDGKVLWIRRN